MNTGIAVIPKLVVTVEGKVKSSNLPAFQKAAKKYVNQINRVFDSDETFGRAELDIKALKASEKLVETEAENIVSQTHDINEVLKTLNFIREEFRRPRLEIEKEVKEQKDSIRIKLMKEASDEVTAHAHRYVDQINNEFAIELSYDAPDFYGAIKGLRTIESVKASIKKEKDAAIFSMTTAANDILAKLAWFKDQGHMEYKFLFGDIAGIIYTELAGFTAMVQLRVNNHIAAEKVKEDKQREKIRIEEETKAKAKIEAEAKAKAQAEAKEKAESEAKAKAALVSHYAEPEAEDLAKTKAEDLAKTPIKEPAKDSVSNIHGIPSPSVPRQVTEEENTAKIAAVKEARQRCTIFMAKFMSLEETSMIRLEMLAFLQKTDWVEE